MTVISTEDDGQPALLIAMQEYLSLSEVRTFAITRVLLFPIRKMLALVFTGTSSYFVSSFIRMTSQ